MHKTNFIQIIFLIYLINHFFINYLSAQNYHYNVITYKKSSVNWNSRFQCIGLKWISFLNFPIGKLNWINILRLNKTNPMSWLSKSYSVFVILIIKFYLKLTFSKSIIHHFWWQVNDSSKLSAKGYTNFFKFIYLFVLQLAMLNIDFW